MKKSVRKTCLKDKNILQNVSIFMPERKISPKKQVITPITYNEFFDLLLPEMKLVTSSIIEAFQHGIKPSEYCVFLLIESYNQKGQPVPSASKLAEYLNMTERNFHTIIKEMTKKDFLELKGKKTKRIYDFSKLKALTHIK